MRLRLRGLLRLQRLLVVLECIQLFVFLFSVFLFHKCCLRLCFRAYVWRLNPGTRENSLNKSEIDITFIMTLLVRNTRSISIVLRRFALFRGKGAGEGAEEVEV